MKESAECLEQLTEKAVKMQKQVGEEQGVDNCII